MCNVPTTATVLEHPPFALAQREKATVFLCDMRAALAWHCVASPPFARLCASRGFDPRGAYALEDIPYVPAAIFKDTDLRSVPEEQIVRTLSSSATSGRPSTIVLDQVTADRQVRALRRILEDFLGRERRQVLVLDVQATVASTGGALSSRGTAIRGMLPLARRMDFLLDDGLALDGTAVARALAAVRPDIGICIVGFTWLLYRTYERAREHPQYASIFAPLAGRDVVAIHIGGWKKLQDRAVSKAQFTADVAAWLHVPSTRVIDVYGMTEQLGTVYPDCAAGHKHVPVYAELIIRDPATLAPVPDRTPGFMQFLSPIPQSYPGVSVLSDDIGAIVGVDDCPCGRKGKSFVFHQRADAAEPKGCGDTLAV